MKRTLIAMLLLACIALTQGRSIAGLIVQDRPAAAAMTDGCADPNDGGGAETPE
jgi:hypothetical protein